MNAQSEDLRQALTVSETEFISQAVNLLVAEYRKACDKIAPKPLIHSQSKIKKVAISVFLKESMISINVEKDDNGWN
ncbi:MAG: hypothetical protein RR064_06325 [Oscillospiraceae bacterium]